MKTDPSHYIRKRRTSKILDEHQQQMQRGWFTSVTSTPGGAGLRWRRQLTLVLLFSIVLFAGSFSSAVHAQEGGHASIAQGQKVSSLLPEGFTEGFISYFSSFQTDAEQIKIYGKKKLPIPVLALGADHSLGTAVETQVAHYATNVTGGVITGSGHWIPEEQPQAFVDQLLAFLNKK